MTCLHERNDIHAHLINLEKVTCDEVISVGFIWSDIEVLHVTGDIADSLYEDVYKDIFEKIADYFPKLRELHISGDMNLMLPFLEIISSMDNLEHLHMEVFNFSANGVMMMSNIKNLKFMYACSTYTNCEFAVDKSSENDSILSKDFINMYLSGENKYEEECVEFGGFEPIPGDQLVYRCSQNKCNTMRIATILDP